MIAAKTKLHEDLRGRLFKQLLTWMTVKNKCTAILEPAYMPGASSTTSLEWVQLVVSVPGVF